MFKDFFHKYSQFIGKLFGVKRERYQESKVADIKHKKSTSVKSTVEIDRQKETIKPDKEISPVESTIEIEKLEKDRTEFQTELGEDKQLTLEAKEKEKDLKPRLKKPILYFNIGVDFGTSTTKVVAREVATNTSYAIPLRESDSDFVKYILPSTIIIRKGQMFFGLGGEEFEKDDEIMRSLKVCLTCCFEKKNCEDENQIDTRLDCATKKVHLREGHLSVEQGSVLYLAFLLRSAHRVLEINFPEKKFEKRFNYVFSAPVDSMETEETLSSFERVAAIAVSLKKEVKQGGVFSEMLSKCENAFGSHHSTKGMCDIRPEAIAAVMPLLVHGAKSLNEGIYAVVDVGAGTTDTSYFRLTRIKDDIKVLIYSVYNEVLGGDNLDRDILGQIHESHKLDPNEKMRWLQAIRVEKREINPEIGFSLSVNGDEAYVPIRDIHEILLNHSHSLRGILTKACKQGFPKEKRDDRWKKQRSFFIGGGTLLAYAKNVLGWGPENINNVDFQVLPLPEDPFTKLPESLTEFPDELHHLFQVAKGLSYHPRSVPLILPPAGVDPYEAPVKAKLDFDPDWWREQD